MKARLAVILLALASCGGDDDGGTIDSGGGGMAPVISMVEWTPAAGCTAGSSGDFTITITVTDPDTPAGSLIYSGMVNTCSPAIASNPATVTCPNMAPYGASVRVEDPEGNLDVASGWTVRPCESGSFSPP
jgi:hypothetical protein